MKAKHFLPNSRSGFTIVELLVAGFIFILMLTVLGSFLSQHLTITRRTQAKHELETNLRTIAEVMVQDLEVAGASVVVNNGVSSQVDMFCAAALATKCISDPAGANDKLTVFYATSLRPTEPCRRIDYRLTNNSTLERLERSATGVNCKTLEALTLDTTAFNLNPLADDITALTISYYCADERTSTDPAVCYSVNVATGVESFPRQATITVQGKSNPKDNITSEVTLTATMPNLKR